MKLSKTQQKVLSKMKTYSKSKWHSAYSLQCSLATLNAMERKGVVERQKGLIAFSIWSPRTAIHFRLRKEE